jgi:hypothetical protein
MTHAGRDLLGSKLVEKWNAASREVFFERGFGGSGG